MFRRGANFCRYLLRQLASRQHHQGLRGAGVGQFLPTFVARADDVVQNRDGKTKCFPRAGFRLADDVLAFQGNR